MTIGYLASSFDMINVRDLNLIAQARALCSQLILGVFSDEFVEDQYGRRPVVPLHERVALVQHVRGVDQVLVHGDDALSLALATDADLVIFTIPDESVIATAGDRIELRPGRMTSSRILRDALVPTRRAAVA